MDQCAPEDFDPAEPSASRRGARIGHASVTFRENASILTRTSGFMADYDFTLNPYSGCSFACTYCYAAFFTRDRALQDSWGYWVQVKENAVDRLRRTRTPLAGKSIYLSSVTDPYQPIERRLGLVRALLEILAERGAHLVVQTRSPWVTRDIDLFGQFERIRVNMTVTTDSETVRRVFEPHCPTTEKRLHAIAEVAAAGVPTCITLTPLLPLDDVEGFVDRLVATGVPRFVVQPFHAAKGRFVAGTRQAAVDITVRYGWDDEAYAQAVKHLRARLPHLGEGRAGFAPQ